MKPLKFIATGILFLLGITAVTGPVNEKQAAKVAVNFYFERIQSVKITQYDDVKVTQVHEIRNGDHLLFYMMNFSTGGFAGVAAIDDVYPVLCYSFGGRYVPENQPENFAMWMKQYEGEILKVITEKRSPQEGIKEVWEFYSTAEQNMLRPFSGREVLPLLTSNWDQGKYYNEMCPADGGGPGGHCYAGCVATAMGQVMNYFRWPDSGLGSYSYYCPPYDTLSADFGNSSYQWDLMETSLGHSNLEVAELLHHLGVSVDMVYGPDGSGMYNHKAAFSMRTYFKYSPETQYVYRDSTTMDWDSLLVAHLDQRIPMYYAGWSLPNINGHAFVCDGYQGTGFYHFNWGWSGSYDGYFYTDNLTPGGSNFNLAQEVIIHAFPDTNLYNYPISCQGDITYPEMFGTIGDGSGPVYPYASGSDCSWLIAPDDSVNSISLNILNLNLSEGDTLKVFDGDSTNAPLLGFFTGDTIPSTVTTTGKVMLITFQTDDTLTEEGFLAAFESAIPVYCSGSTVLNAQTDTLTDGSGNYDYHNNSTCTWIINPPGASTVTLYFDEFETEEGFDFLKIYDLATSQLIAELSGTYPNGVPEPVTSPSGKMFLAFSTNYSVTAGGWTAYYETDLVDIPENEQARELVIYPNPAGDYVLLELNGANEPGGKLSLIDLNGKVLFTRPVEFDGNNQTTLQLTRIKPGFYFLVLDLEDNSRISCKIARM